jgi:hypothetical protein
VRRAPLLALCAVAVAMLVPASAVAVSGAAFTTDNPTVTDECLHGPSGDGSAVNCNIYGSKDDVWINGGPSAGQNHLSSGTYFFAVLEPGGQPDPNDGGASNLSDTTVDDRGAPDSGTGDDATNRVFTVDGSGHIAGYAGTHATDDGGALGTLIQLIPYDDTRNPGGVYILAICQISSSQLTLPVGSVSSVDPRDCKYDAFKVRQAETPPAADLTVTKSADESFDRTYRWTIDKSADKTTVTTTDTTVTINYTVSVSHDAGTDGNWAVNGAISVFNPNTFDVVVDVTDAIDDPSATCSVTGGDDATIPAESSESFAYVCSYSAAPALGTTNTATVSWDEQGALAAGSAHFPVALDFGGVTPSAIDECISVSDDQVGALGTACVGDAMPKTFTYSRTVSVPRNACVDYDNTATFTATDSGATGSDSWTVTVCGPITNGFTLGFWSNKNGEAAMKTCGGGGGAGMAVTLAYLSSLNLVNKNGSAFDPATYTAFKNWLLGGDAVNMSYMLAVQLAATALDVKCMGMLGTACVAHPVTGAPITIDALIAEANAFLGSNPNTSVAGAARTLAQAYKNKLDQLNNNLAFAVPCA